MKIHKNLFSVFALVAIGVFAALSIKPAAMNVFASFAQAERKLPIYCVETEEKKVAISFDAAWGALPLGKIKTVP